MPYSVMVCEEDDMPGSFATFLTKRAAQRFLDRRAHLIPMKFNREGKLALVQLRLQAVRWRDLRIRRPQRLEGT